MAFMMPVVRKNYNIYGDSARKPTDAGDGRKNSRKISQGSASSGGSRPGSQKKVRSECPSLSTSAGAQGEVIIHRIPIPQRSNSNGSGHPPLLMSRSVPIRGRGSEPVLTSVPAPFLRNNSLPEGSKVDVPLSPTHSTGSSSSTSSTDGHNRFHIKLLNRLKKSFRIKEPAPAAS